MAKKEKIITFGEIMLRLSTPDHQTINESYILEGLWIKSLGDINLAYQNNGGGDVLKIPAEFRYQYVYREGDGDPLDASN